jgi:cobalt-zinc-cadmium efflux system protein
MHDHRHDKPPSLNIAADQQAAAAQERRVFWALLITGSFMVAEVVGGIVSGSLALLADAGHMLTDTGALALSWYAFRVGRRPATPLHSYGQHRFQVLAALINGATLIGIAVWIGIEAARRFFAPVEILGGTMLVVALTGLMANIAAFTILHGGSHDNLNVRGAALHVLGDLLGSAAAIVAAVVILITGWAPIDPLLSVLVALLIVRSAWSLITKSWHVLMEGTPQGIDTGSLEKELVAAAPGVLGVHHVHLWSLTPERPLITLHANIAQGTDHDAALHRLKHLLAERFGLSHATIQIERATCADDGPRQSTAPRA